MPSSCISVSTNSRQLVAGEAYPRCVWCQRPCASVTVPGLDSVDRSDDASLPAVTDVRASLPRLRRPRTAPQLPPACLHSQRTADPDPAVRRRRALPRARECTFFQCRCQLATWRQFHSDVLETPPRVGSRMQRIAPGCCTAFRHQRVQAALIALDRGLEFQAFALRQDGDAVIADRAAENTRSPGTA